MLLAWLISVAIGTACGALGLWAEGERRRLKAEMERVRVIGAARKPEMIRVIWADEFPTPSDRIRWRN